jgi:hypothetical protein
MGATGATGATGGQGEQGDQGERGLAGASGVMMALNRNEAQQMEIPRVGITELKPAELVKTGGNRSLFPKASSFLAMSERQRKRTPGSSLIELAKLLQLG